MAGTFGAWREPGHLERLAPGMEGTLHCATSYADANFCGGFPETVAFAIHQGQPIEAAGPYDNGEPVGTERFSLVARGNSRHAYLPYPNIIFFINPMQYAVRMARPFAQLDLLAFAIFVNFLNKAAGPLVVITSTVL